MCPARRCCRGAQRAAQVRLLLSVYVGWGGGWGGFGWGGVGWGGAGRLPACLPPARLPACLPAYQQTPTSTCRTSAAIEAQPERPAPLPAAVSDTPCTEAHPCTASLVRLLQVRTKELRQVRRLAQEVLLQRSDVEAFLVSSIQQARREMAAEAAAAAAGAPGALQHAPAAGSPLQILGPPAPAGPASGGETVICSSPHANCGAGSALGQMPLRPAPGESACTDSSSSSSSQPGVSPAAAAAATGGTGSSSTASGTSGQVDISQLSWRDRERILRLLFSKINRANQVKAPGSRYHQRFVILLGRVWA